MQSFAQDSPSEASRPLTLRTAWGTTAPSQASLIKTCTTRSTGNSQATRKPKLVVGSLEKNNVRALGPLHRWGWEEQMEAGSALVSAVPPLTRSSKHSRQGEEEQAVATAEVPLSPHLCQGYPDDA